MSRDSAAQARETEAVQRLFESVTPPPPPLPTVFLHFSTLPSPAPSAAQGSEFPDSHTHVSGYGSKYILPAPVASNWLFDFRAPEDTGVYSHPASSMQSNSSDSTNPDLGLSPTAEGKAKSRLQEMLAEEGVWL